MSSLGSYLRKQRESLGYTLKEVSEETKIRIHYLEAIEEDDVGALPGEPYVKGFIKSYAQFLGLDPEKIWNQYGWSKGKEEAKQEIHPPKELGLGWLFVAFGFILGIAIVAVFAQYAQQKKVVLSNDYTSEAIERFALVPETTATEPIVPPEIILPEQLVLEIRAIKHSWVMIVADEDTVLSGELRPGAKAELVARDKFIINLGRFLAVEVFLNGNKLEAFNQPQRRILRAEINRQSYNEYLR